MSVVVFCAKNGKGEWCDECHMRFECYTEKAKFITPRSLSKLTSDKKWVESLVSRTIRISEATHYVEVDTKVVLLEEVFDKEVI